MTTVTESNAISRMLRWLLGTGPDITREQAQEAAAFLASRSNRVLAAGITPREVHTRWPAQPPAELVAEIERLKAAPAYPAPGSAIPDQPGYVVGECGHRVAGSEWRTGFHNCERCPHEPKPEPLLDPDCRDGKHASCFGEPCECHCHPEAAE